MEATYAIVIPQLLVASVINAVLAVIMFSTLEFPMPCSAKKNGRKIQTVERKAQQNGSTK
jgi:hypothetical protein